MMAFDNSNVRRQDRLLDEERAVALLRTAEWGVLSMCDTDGAPYGLPLNYVWDGASSLYIHCAPEGRKLRCLEHEQRVSFCIVGNVNLLPSKFTTEYESIVLTTLSEKHYGSPLFWVYIYEENVARGTINDPNNIRPGTRVVIPPASKYGINPNDKASLKKAQIKSMEYLKGR